MKTFRRTGMILGTLMLLAGCGGTAQEVQQDGVIAEVQQANATWRADQVGDAITIGEGSWGEWQQTVFCNAGMYAAGYKMRVESSQGNGDDTALNSVALYCTSPNGSSYPESITSHNGIWGTWGDLATCNGSYLKTAHMRIEAPQGSGDDTGANDVEFTCTNGSTVHALNGQGWGTWGYWQSCPSGTAVCGLSIRFEADQGTNADDSAMNGLRLYCCAL